MTTVASASGLPAITIIIPAYNESTRLPPYLATIRAHCDVAYRSSYEVIVVDDGSLDCTADAVTHLQVGWPQLVLLRHATNLGKGAALKSGTLASRGAVVLLADADGATPIVEECLLQQALRAGAHVAVGSRDSPRAHRARHRRFIGRMFALLIHRYLGLPLCDTQCGFKMFCRARCLHLVTQCSERGFLFDVEFLAIAHRNGLITAHVPVCWREVPGSKVRVVRDSWRMAIGLLRLRRRLQVEDVTRDVVRQH